MKRKNIINIILIISIILGLLAVGYGTVNNYRENQKTKGYEETIATFVESNLKSHDDKTGLTYELTYSYLVSGNEYLLYEESRVNDLADIENTKTIKYDPKDPEQAVLLSDSTNNYLIFGGFIFVIIAYLIKFSEKEFIIKNKKNKNYNIIVIILGTIIVVIGVILYLYLVWGSNSFNPIDAYKIIGYVLLIPIVVFIQGLVIIIKTIMFLNEKKALQE